MKIRTIALAALVLLAGVGPLVAAGDGTETQAYSGAHVSFQADGGTVTNYTVEGDTVATALQVQSTSDVESDLGIGVEGDLSAVTDFAAAELSFDARTEASATVSAESGATLRAHDYEHGTLVVDSGGESQYVGLNLSAESRVDVESDQRAVVTTGNGTEAAVLVAGGGEVTVDEEGNLTATVAADGKLVVRSYDDRSEEDREEERLIVEGEAAAEVYVDEQESGTVSGSVTYDANTSVTVEQRSEGKVEATVDRSQHDGKVVVVSGVDAETSLTASVDGEAAAKVSGYSELRAATDGGSTSKYMVQGSADAEATVLVAVNHFSERQVTVSESNSGEGSTSPGGSDGDSSSGDDPEDSGDPDGSGAATGTDGDATGGAGPGFGVAMVVSAILGLFGLATLRDDARE
jgi:hypothetical protein